MANPTGSKTKYAGSRSGPGTQKSPRVGRSSPPAMARPREMVAPRLVQRRNRIRLTRAATLSKSAANPAQDSPPTFFIGPPT